MATIKLEIVSPDKVVYENDITMLIVRSTGGELGILPHHAPLVAGLVAHAMRIRLIRVRLKARTLISTAPNWRCAARLRACAPAARNSRNKDWLKKSCSPAAGLSFFARLFVRPGWRIV